MSELVAVLQANAPLVVVVGIGFWRVLLALHKIDRRLVRVETRMGIEDAKS